MAVPRRRSCFLRSPVLRVRLGAGPGQLEVIRYSETAIQGEKCIVDIHDPSQSLSVSSHRPCIEDYSDEVNDSIKGTVLHPSVSSHRPCNETTMTRLMMLSRELSHIPASQVIGHAMQ